jgi:hypothetical protein
MTVSARRIGELLQLLGAVPISMSFRFELTYPDIRDAHSSRQQIDFVFCRRRFSDYTLFGRRFVEMAVALRIEVAAETEQSKMK